MDAVKAWITGLTAVAVVATVASSPYSANILTSLFRGVGQSYNLAKH